jgi:uncharacterized damage-inducible protein DinB
MTSAKERFLEAYDREHETTMRILRAYPEDKQELRPHPRLKNARELAFVFVLERGLGTKVWHDEMVKSGVSGKAPEAPAQLSEVIAALEKANADFRELVSKATDEELQQEVHFFVAPKTMGEYTRIDWIWFLLHDQIHHRGQFSVYLRMADGKVPSIYGPSGDEPWI